jgi:agmatine/peptidylarginine deiminase
MENIMVKTLNKNPKHVLLRFNNLKQNQNRKEMEDVDFNGISKIERWIRGMLMIDDDNRRGSQNLQKNGWHGMGYYNLPS